MTTINQNGNNITADIILNFCSGTLTEDSWWEVSESVCGNVTLVSGKTLTVTPNTTVTFSSGTSVTINGSLVANSTVSGQRITFTGTTPTPGFWNGIRINSGSSTNVSTLRRCDVKYATNGIYIAYTGNTNNVTIDKCRINNNSDSGIFVYGLSTATVHPTIRNSNIQSNSGNGITLQNYAKPKVAVNRVEFNGGYGINAIGTACSAKVDSNYVAGNYGYGMAFLLSSIGEVHRNTIVENLSNGGIYVSSSSNVVANGSGNSKGRNDISSNIGDGIYSFNSSPIFGTTSLSGNNQILYNTVYQAKQAGTGQLKAENCWWAGNQGDISGNVDNSPYLSAAPSPLGWSYSEFYDPSLFIRSGDDIVVVNTLIFARVANEGLIQNAAAFTTGFDPAAWSKKFDEAMTTGLEKGDWADAAAAITELWRELQDSYVPEVDYKLLIDYTENAAVESSIRKYLALTLVEKSLASKDIAAALADLNQYQQKLPEHEAELLANIGSVNLHFQNDVTAAENVLAQLHAKAAQNDLSAVEEEKLLATMIANYRQNFGVGAAALKIAGNAPAAVQTLAASLSANYPNPFNPATKVHFYLNSHQKVRLVIYDLAGHRVRTLVDGELSMGEQAISWDGRDQYGKPVASGIYFYELVANNQIERKKMTLVR